MRLEVLSMQFDVSLGVVFWLLSFDKGMTNSCSIRLMVSFKLFYKKIRILIRNLYYEGILKLFMIEMINNHLNLPSELLSGFEVLRLFGLS